MLAAIADSPNEGALEGAGALNERYVQFMEARLENPSQAQALFQGDTGGIGANFPKAIVGTDSITFSVGSESSTFSGMESFGPNPIGDAVSSLVQSVLQMPGPIGLLTQLFQFLGAFFGAMAQAFTQTVAQSYAMAAQAAMDMKKMMIAAG